MAVMSVPGERGIIEEPLPFRIPAANRRFTRTLEIWMGGSSEGFTPGLDLTGSRALSPPSRLPGGQR